MPIISLQSAASERSFRVPTAKRVRTVQYNLRIRAQCTKMYILFYCTSFLGIAPCLKCKHTHTHTHAHMRCVLVFILACVLCVALTSTKLGAAISNYCEVIELDKTYDPVLKKVVCSGALVRDRLTGEPATRPPVCPSSPISSPSALLPRTCRPTCLLTGRTSWPPVYCTHNLGTLEYSFRH